MDPSFTYEAPRLTVYWRNTEQYEWVREEAHRRRISMAELIRRILDEAQEKTALQEAAGRTEKDNPR